jgi:protein gp37
VADRWRRPNERQQRDRLDRRDLDPVTGCAKVSPGCANCYAETLSLRNGWSRLPWTPENAVENMILGTYPIQDRRRSVGVNEIPDAWQPPLSL